MEKLKEMAKFFKEIFNPLREDGLIEWWRVSFDIVEIKHNRDNLDRTGFIGYRKTKKGIKINRQFFKEEEKEKIRDYIVWYFSLEKQVVEG